MPCAAVNSENPRSEEVHRQVSATPIPTRQLTTTVKVFAKRLFPMAREISSTIGSSRCLRPLHNAARISARAVHPPRHQITARLRPAHVIFQQLSVVLAKRTATHVPLLAETLAMMPLPPSFQPHPKLVH